MSMPEDPFAPPTGAAPRPVPPEAPTYGPPQPGAPQPGAPQYGAPQYGAPLYGEPLPVRRNGLGVAALVLGVLSLLPFVAIFVVPAILAVVFGIVGRKRAKRGEATNGGVALAGAILGGLGLVVTSLVMAVLVWVFTSDTGREYLDCMEAASGNTEAEDACARQAADSLFGR